MVRCLAAAAEGSSRADTERQRNQFVVQRCCMQAAICECFQRHSLPPLEHRQEVYVWVRSKLGDDRQLSKAESVQVEVALTVDQICHPRRLWNGSLAQSSSDQLAPLLRRCRDCSAEVPRTRREAGSWQGRELEIVWLFSDSKLTW